MIGFINCIVLGWGEIKHRQERLFTAASRLTPDINPASCSCGLHPVGTERSRLHLEHPGGQRRSRVRSSHRVWSRDTLNHPHLTCVFSKPKSRLCSAYQTMCLAFFWHPSVSVCPQVLLCSSACRHDLLTSVPCGCGWDARVCGGVNEAEHQTEGKFPFIHMLEELF